MSILTTALSVLSVILWVAVVAVIFGLVERTVRLWLKRRRTRRYYAEIFESAGLRLVGMTEVGTDHTHFSVEVINAPQFSGSLQERMIHAALIAQMRPMP